MKKNIISIIIIGIVIVGAAAALNFYKIKPVNNGIPIQNESKLDPKNATYDIEGEAVTLKNGAAETEIALDSAENILTEYFGNEAVDDFNGDGYDDVAFLLVQSGGGTGVFYYIAAVLGDGGKGTATNTIFIGDRIAPQSAEFRNGMIIVNYADRKPDEPFSVRPSVGASNYFKIVDDKLVEVTLNMSESDARAIAERSCIKGGEALGEGAFNENSKTWWFDANLNAAKEGCNPACVVSEETRTAEINWRCTGLITPE